MDIERIVVRLVADTASYIDGLNRAQARLLYFASFVTEQVGRSVINLAMDFERLTIAFEVMTGSAEVGLKVLNDITKLAIDSPFTSGELISAGKQVKAFGFDTQDIIPILGRLGDVSVATGTDINRIILAFGQVRTTGRLMGQELRQFTNAGIPILEYLAKVMGVATSAVPQLVRQGRVGFADVAEAFNRMTSDGGLFFGMMERTNLETVWGRWQNVVESVQVALRNMGLEFFQLFKVNERLTVLVDLLKSLNSEGGLEGARQKFRDIKNYADFIVEPVRRIVDATLAWYQANKEVVDTVVITLAVIKAITVAAWLMNAPFTALIATLRVVYTTLVAIRSVILGTAIITSLATVGTFLAAIVGTVVSITVILAKVAVILVLIVASVVAAVMLFKVMAFFAMEVWKTIQAIGETDLWKILTAVTEGAGGSLAQMGSQFLAGLKKAMGPVGELLADLFGSARDKAVEIFGGVWARVTEYVGRFVTQGKKELLSFWTWLAETGAAAWDYLLGFFDRGIEQAKKFGETFQSSMGSVADAIRGGEAKLAWDILFATLKVGWQRLIGWLKIEWSAFNDTIDIWLNKTWDTFALRVQYGLKIAAENLVAGGARVPAMEAERDRLIRNVTAAAEGRYRGVDFDRNQMLRALDENVRRGPAMAELLELRSLAGVVRDAGSRIKELAELYAKIPTRYDPRALGNVPVMSQFEPPPLDLSALAGGVGGAAAVMQYRSLSFNAMQAARTFQNMLHQQMTDGEGAIDQGVLAAARTRALETADALDKFVAAMTRTSRAAQELINVPLEVSAGARMLAAEIGREMERGIDPMQKFTQDWVRLTEALTGPLQTPENVSAITAVLGGPALMGNSKLVNGIIDQETHDFGLFRSYENFRKWLPNVETARPVAAMAGSREAWEIMSRANVQQIDVQERIRNEIMTGNAIATAQYQEQQRATAALEELRKQGVVIPRRIGQRGR